MKPPQWLGVAILAAVLAIATSNAIWVWANPPAPAVLLVEVEGGNLKAPFFANEDVQRILSERYNLKVNFKGDSTTTIICSDLTGVDAVWIGEQSQIAIYEDCQKQSDPFRNIFLSPMVIYSWTDTIDALIGIGVASQDADGAYHVDMPKLLELLESGKTWSDIGLPDRPSDIKVSATDPESSSSGRSFAALMANTMNCLEVVDSNTVDTVLQDIYIYFQGLGYLEPSSLALFESYLTLGEGARPMVALIESQIAEYLTTHPDDAQLVADKVRMLYPSPTLWTSHPVIARTDAGDQLMRALLDPELQELGWEIIGFRPAVPGVGIDLSAADVPGILPDITSVIDTPGDEVMAQITAATKTDPGPGSPRRDCN